VGSLQRASGLLLFFAVLHPFSGAAAQQNGAVRAADRFVPGATVTARLGERKVIVYTDEHGRYTMDLTPGVWEVQVEMFEFTPVHAEVTVTGEPGFREWAIEIPRPGETAPKTEVIPEAKAPEAKVPPGLPQPPAQPAARVLRDRSGPAGQRPRPGFQNAQVKATQEGQQALAGAVGAPVGEMPGAADEGDEAFVVAGSNSGGLAASSDEESRRQRLQSRGNGGPGGPGGDQGGPGGVAGLGVPPGMAGATADSLGLGGFGASAINGGFGGGPGGGPGFGGGGPGGGGPGGGGGRGGGGGGGGGGRTGRNAQRQGRGPNNGQFASFGNRRRSQPAYSGSVFINLNNSALNAAPFSLNGRFAPKASYDQARFGANIGGPMVIPKIMNWQRASFSFNYQGSLSRNPYTQVSSVPTLAERNGDFSQAITNTPVTLYDPLGGSPFVGNIIPQSRINPAAAGLLKYFPLPTYTGLVQNYQIVASVPNNNNSIGVRLNAPLTTKDRLNFNVQYQDRNSESEQLFGYRDNTTGSGLSASAGWSHSFAPRFNSSANLTFSRNNNKNAPFFAYSSNVAAALGITGTSQDPINYGPPSLSFTNFGSLSDGTASVSRNQTFNFTENITYVIKRKHNITAGFLFRKLQQNTLAYQNARGSFTFSGLLTSALSPSGQPQQGTGFDFADFLLGLPQSSSLRYGSDNNYFRSWATSVFGQDDWRISRGLSLNVGLRYEYFAPYTELRGHLANLDVSPGYSAVAVVTPGQNGPYSGSLPTSLVRSDPNNVSPRIGISWRPSPKKSTVIRSGYSIFYSGSSYSQIATQLASQPPFAKTSSVSTSTANPLTLENGFFTPVSETITNTYSIDPNYKLAYAQTWNFAIQNTLPHGFLVELEYIGTKGTDLGIVEQPNRASPGASLLNAQQSLQIANASGFNYQTSQANSSFNAGQVRVTRRFSRGMSGTALYAFSKAIDDASSFNGTGGTTVQFIDDLRAERGLSTFDQRHRLQLTYLLSSPVGVHGMMRNGGWKTAALAGWTLNGNMTAASGAPLTARVSGNLSNTGGTGAFGGGRAEATGLSIDGGSNPYFNPLAFTTPPAGQYGNAGRDTIPGPFQFALNASLNRAFRFGESRRQLQLRLSANNALNHVAITSFGTTVNSSTFGLPTAASATRTVTLLLRFSF
jgi:hypothetical protein